MALQSLEECLGSKEYPGRVIGIGMDDSGNGVYAFYAITGRSKSSKARELVEHKNGVITVEPTDKVVFKKGSPSLLLYPAFAVNESYIIVSNGVQTEVIYSHISKNLKKERHLTPYNTLTEVFKFPHSRFDPRYGWIKITDREPDAPNFTPRISGCLNSNNATLHIVGTKGGWPDDDKKRFDIMYKPGEGKVISTYTGENTDPLPPFEGDALKVKLNGKNIKEIADEVYYSLNEKYRVAVGVVSLGVHSKKISNHIINKHDKAA